MEAYLIYKISPYPSLPKRGIWIVFSKGEGIGIIFHLTPSPPPSPIKGEGNSENVSSRERGILIVFSNGGKYWGNSPIEGEGNSDILYY